MRLNIPTLYTLLLLLLVGQSGAVHSDDSYSVQDWHTIVNLAGKQRMLTQQISKEILLIAASSENKGLNTADIYSELLESTELFEQTLIGLRDGNEELNLRPVKNSAIKAKLEIVIGMWQQLKPDIDHILTTSDTKGYIAVASQALPLLNEMNSTVHLIEKTAIIASGETNSTIINYAGRQRMLIQKMAKEALLIHLSGENRNSLFRSIWMFEETLRALINGGEITKDDNEKITIQKVSDSTSQAQLRRVDKSWAGYKSLLNNKITAQSIIHISNWSKSLLIEMNRAVKMLERKVP
ncbi:MAG: type IV pili methyl-accepting chemotaxis transducer N-terminal domain-containing protein [Candidatus Polarisedimenticolaceae bacterium]|nr:type IV pili methyl-accepting chemotaxis transducer N-terminal domain-containing protein [Candidatus Polarisedimenticolaceae bacterium]